MQFKKLYTPPSLNALCGLLEHQYMFSPSVIVMHESSIVLDFKIITNTQKMLENQRKCRRQRAGSLTVQHKRRTHEQLSLNIKTVVDHPGNDTQH